MTAVASTPTRSPPSDGLRRVCAFARQGFLDIGGLSQLGPSDHCEIPTHA